MVTGSTAARSNFSTLLFPSIRLNQAVSMQGIYRIGNVDTDLVPGATVAWADIEVAAMVGHAEHSSRVARGGQAAV